jgi:probable phosphoglycerate mutase
VAARLFAVRHGETEWSLSGQHTGRTDVPLTDAGRERAKQVGAFLAGRTFALVLTSPFSRARETATLAGFPDAPPGAHLHDGPTGRPTITTTAMSIW